MHAIGRLRWNDQNSRHCSWQATKQVEEIWIICEV